MADVTARIDAALQQIEEREKGVHALLADETPKQRRQRLHAEIRELEARWPDEAARPPLFGALLGVKDIFHAAGFPTRAGSALPPEVFLEQGAAGLPDTANGGDATSVRLLRDAGALVLAKTVTTEFAYFGPGPTANPLNLAHTPGGSSSGSAAAVAAGYCDLALGTQTIGSISRPATFCGVVGYKPSFGRISTAGVVPFSGSADHVGVIARTVETLTAAAGALVSDWKGPAPEASTRRGPVTVLVPHDEYFEQADPAARAALEAVSERLRGLGVHVQEVRVFQDIESINGLHQDMIAGEFAAVHKSWFDRHKDLYHPRSRELIQRGRAISPERLQEGRAGRQELRHRIAAALSRHEASLWIAPATTGEAPEGLGATGNPIMNLPWTYAGVPTVSLPVHKLPGGTGPAGLPLGIQVATPFDTDELLLPLAQWLEYSLT